MANYVEIDPPRTSEIAQRLVYNTIWAYSSKKSIVSGLWLREYANTPLFANCFYHVLPVDKFRYFRHYLKSIVLVTPGERGLILQGTEEERIQYALDIEDRTKGTQTANWGILKTLGAELQEEYKKSFPVTVGMLIGYKYSLHKQSKIIGELNKRFLESL